MLMLSKSKLLHPLLQECHCLWQSKYVEPDLDVLLLDVLHLFNIGVNSWLLACHAKLEPHDGGGAIISPDADLVEQMANKLLDVMVW